MQEQQPVIVTRREISSSAAAKNINEKVDALELLNVSLSSYLKDLYINFSFHGGNNYPFKNQHIIVANTIQSYTNQAKSELSV